MPEPRLRPWRKGWTEYPGASLSDFAPIGRTEPVASPDAAWYVTDGAGLFWNGRQFVEREQAIRYTLDEASVVRKEIELELGALQIPVALIGAGSAELTPVEVIEQRAHERD